MTTPWYRSSFSGSADSCVEVRFHDDKVLIRDSKYHTSGANPIIALTSGEWIDFLSSLDGGTRRDRTAGPLGIVTTGTDTSLVEAKSGIILTFSSFEWLAFVTGVKAGEFDGTQHFAPRTPTSHQWLLIVGQIAGIVAAVCAVIGLLILLL